jgi:cytochrome bd-type quinol oxidase subunit 2
MRPSKIQMNSKVTGKASHVLAYFSALLAIIAIACLIVFLVQWLQMNTENVSDIIFSRAMLALQASQLGILLPAILFCSYLSIRLRLNSRFFRWALNLAAAAMLPIFPLVSPLGLYTFWLSNRRR